MNVASQKISKLKDLKSPKGNFLLGNLSDFNKKNKHYILEEWAKQYGDFYTIKLGPKRVLVTSDTESKFLYFKTKTS